MTVFFVCESLVKGCEKRLCIY